MNLPPHKALDRKLGLWSVMAIAIGAAAAPGIFILPAIAADVAGPMVGLSYLLAGIFVLPAVFSKAELASSMPVAGGTYVYIERSLGPLMGTITGIGTWLSLSAKTAFALVGLSTYLVYFTSMNTLPLTMAILALLLALNVVGVGKVKVIQAVVVSFTLACVFFLTSVGMASGDPVHLEPMFPHGSSGILTGAALVFVSYSGVTKVCSVAEEIKNPVRNIPLGMFLSQGIIMVIYVVVCFIITTNIPMDQLLSSGPNGGPDITPITTLAEITLGTKGALFFAFVAIVGLLAMCNAGVLATSRFPFAMARDSLLPTPIANVSKSFGTPVSSILLTGVLLCFLIMADVTTLAKLASGFKLFVFCIVNLSVIALRESGVTWYQPTFKSPFYPYVQIVGALFSIILLVMLGPTAWLGVGASIILGVLWYYVYARHRVDRTGVLTHLRGEVKILKQTMAMERSRASADPSDNRVIVPLFGQEKRPERLVEIASVFIDEGALDIVALKELPDQTTLGMHLHQDWEGVPFDEEHQALLQRLHLEVSYNQLLTHNAKALLHNHALETGTEWIVMEWPSRGELRYLLRHPMAWWIDHAPCDVAIFLDRTSDADAQHIGFKKILIYAVSGPYDSLIAHVADQFAALDPDVEITLVGFLSPLKAGKRGDLEAYHDQICALTHSTTTSFIEVTDNPTDSIKKLSKDFDLLILGAPPEHTIRNLFMRPKEYAFAQAAQCSVLKVKAPKHRVHHRLGLIDTPTEEIIAPHVRLEDALVMTQVEVARKSDLFHLIANELSQMTMDISRQTIESALWARERRQNTSFIGGLAISGPTLPALSTTITGLFCLKHPLNFESPIGGETQVMLVVLSPPTERQIQLRIMEQFANQIRGTSLSQIIKAKTKEEVIFALTGYNAMA